MRKIQSVPKFQGKKIYVIFLTEIVCLNYIKEALRLWSSGSFSFRYWDPTIYPGAIRDQVVVLFVIKIGL